MDKAHAAPRCSARSKRRGRLCRARSKRVGRMHVLVAARRGRAEWKLSPWREDKCEAIELRRLIRALRSKSL